MKRTAFVFSHVHWDIEWYLPFRSFRFWLLKSLDHLAARVAPQRNFKSFVFDGQVAPLDHYLEVKPEQEPVIRKLVRSGKLAVGPFYTQYDEWLVSPESIVRNCLYGNRRAREFGRVMKAGYLPDNFGHPPQMPQILAGFGIDSLIFMRGMPECPKGVEDQFRWVGLDGTRALALHMRHTYCALHTPGGKANSFGPPMFRPAPYGEYTQTSEYIHAGARFTDMKAGVQRMIECARKVGETCPTGVIPLPNGFDCATAQETIAELIDRANAAQDEFEFVQGNCEELVRAVRRRGAHLPEYRGELWGGRYQLILTGTLSTRTYLKQANFIAEALLEKYAEPLCAMATLDKAAWPTRQLEEAWRWLFLNHAHDGIHGSSADPAHEEMIQRFNAAKQIAVGLAHEALAALAARRDSPRNKGKLVLAYNPASRDAGVPVLDTWIQGFDPAKHHIADAQDRSLPVQVVENPWAADQPVKDASWAPAWPDGNPTHVLVAAPIPAGGLAELQVCDGRSGKPSSMGRQSNRAIENELVRIRFVRGSLELYDKATRRTYSGLGVLEEEAERGDAWDFSLPWTASPLLSSSRFPSTCRLIEAGPVRATLEVVTTMRVPRRLEGEKRSREMVDLTVTTRVSLCRGARRADITVTFDNQACDHRIRMRIPSGISADTVKSQGHFGMLVKPIRNPDEGKTGWAQLPPITFHFREWVAVDDGKRGLAVACRGLHEYESKHSRRGVDLFITLLRGYGRMGRSNFKTRAGATSPTTPTPGAQCPGPQKFEFAFLPYDGVTRACRAPFVPEAEAFLYPPMAHQADPDHVLVEPAVLAAGRKNVLPTPPFELEPGNLRFSAFKRAVDGDGWILRFWENEGRRVRAKVRLAPVFAKVMLADLNEQTVAPLKRDRSGVVLTVEPYKIITLKLLTR